MNYFQLRILLGFILALALTILPLPNLLANSRPPWVLILALYIQFFLPEQFYLYRLVIIGLILDVLLATVIGEHSFALLATSWLASRKERRIVFFSLSQQVILVGFLNLFYQLLIIFIEMFLGYSISLISAFLSAGTSIIIWPWVRLIADDYMLRKPIKNN